MKTTEEMIEVMQAHLRGETVEFIANGIEGWTPTSEPRWSWGGFDYRIAPKPAPTQDTIPWDAIDERFKWAARDADADIAAFEDKPILDANYWLTRAGDCIDITGSFVGVQRGTIDWRESLQERPAAEEKRP